MENNITEFKYEERPYKIPIGQIGYELIFRFVISIALIISCLCSSIGFFSIVGMMIGAYGLFSIFKIFHLCIDITETMSKDFNGKSLRHCFKEDDLWVHHIGWVLSYDDIAKFEMEKENDTK